MKIIRCVEAATGAPINVISFDANEGAPGPVNRSVQASDQEITLTHAAAVFNSTAREIANGTELVDVDVFVQFGFSHDTEVSENPTESSLTVEVVDQDGGNIGQILAQQFFIVSTDSPTPQRVFCARFVGRILGTGQIHARITMGDGGDTTMTCGIVKCEMSWIVRPLLGTIFVLTD